MENWNETIPLPENDAELLKIRKDLNRRNWKTILTSLLLAVVILLVSVYGIIPAVEKLYWGPYDSDYDAGSDLKLTLQAYTELYQPGRSLQMIAGKTGFATYDLHITRTDDATGEQEYIGGTLKRGLLDLDSYYFNTRTEDLYLSSDYYADPSEETKDAEPFDMREMWSANTADVLSQLPEYIRLKAVVHFPEDLSMEQFQQLLFKYNYDAREGVSVLWSAVRVGGEHTSGFPIGFAIHSYNGYELNETYPEFFIDSFDPDGSHMAQHFQSLLRFQSDQAAKDRGPFFRNAAGEYSAYVLDYVEEHGVNTYACLVSATPQGLQNMLDDGTASHVILMDGWIDVG